MLLLKPGRRIQRRRVTVEQVEGDYFAKHRTDIDGEADQTRREILARPLGYINADWETMKGQMQPGDELWEFCSPKKSWDMLMGRSGVELVRNGEVISSIVWLMS
jgi:hypothetical protein